ncbi:MAG: hypothetical protein U1E56_03395 [Bauldia sp.]
MSTNGLIGALIGLLIAVVEYVTIYMMFERRAAERMASSAPAERDGIQRMLGIFRVVFRANFVVLPVVGYVLGHVLFP